jgi:hypothetical protein
MLVDDFIRDLEAVGVSYTDVEADYEPVDGFPTLIDHIEDEPDAYNVILDLCEWGESKQGFDYWVGVCETLKELKELKDG